MCGQRHPSAALHPRKTRYPLCGRLGGPQGQSGWVRKSLPPTQHSSTGSEDGRFDILQRVSLCLYWHNILLQGSFTIICYYWIGHGPLFAVCIMRTVFWGFVVLLPSSAVPVASLFVTAVCGHPHKFVDCVRRMYVVHSLLQIAT